MLVQVNTNRYVEADANLASWIESELNSSLERFAEKITRVEVFLRDVNSHKGGPDDKRCLLEARLGGLQPIIASEEASDLDDAINGAIKKLVTTLDRTLGKLGDHKGQTSYGGDQTI